MKALTSLDILPFFMASNEMNHDQHDLAFLTNPPTNVFILGIKR